jgi:hypothetical protein
MIIVTDISSGGDGSVKLDGKEEVRLGYRRGQLQNINSTCLQFAYLVTNFVSTFTAYLLTVMENRHTFQGK